MNMGIRQDGVRAHARAALSALFLLGLGACSPPEAPPPPPPGSPVTEFDLAARQDANKHYAFDQINTENVRNLAVAWTYHTGDNPAGPQAPFVAFEDEPIVLDGNLIICTPSRRIIALDPATGEERWSYDPGGNVGSIYKCRGVVAWVDPQAAASAPCKTRILYATADNRLVALDSKTGALCEGFGAQGIVQIEPTVPELFRGELTLSSRPALVNGVIVVGSAVADNQRVTGPSGRVLAFDARTGRQRWEFDPIPRGRANPASATWSNGAGGADISGANVWSTMSVDEANDIVYLPTTTARNDFFGGNHPGDNLYTTSVVALRGSTGQIVWHFQTSHHDVWDYDLPTGPILIDYPVEGGGTAPALIQLTKQGLIFVLNRLTGEPLVPVEERPVPQEGGVPEETLSPTQPFPVGMPVLAPQQFTEADAWGFTPFDRDSCRRELQGLLHGPIYTPPSVQGTVMMPGPSGGANWGGGAYHPSSHVVVVPSTRVPMVLSLVPRTEAAQANQGSVESRGAMTFPAEGTPYQTRIRPLMSSAGAPCSKPPWAALVAVDIVNRRIVWDVPLGTIDRLAPVPLPIALGTPGAGGPLVTEGGLVFIGHTLDHRFRAFDLRTGRELWKSPPLPAPANSTPITYEVGGVQYVVVTAGGHSMYGTARSDTVIAYRLARS